MLPLLTAVLPRGGVEPCTDLHAAVQRPGRTQGPLVYSSVANNVTAEETPLAPSSSDQQRAPCVWLLTTSIHLPLQHLSLSLFLSACQLSVGYKSPESTGDDQLDHLARVSLIINNN